MMDPSSVSTQLWLSNVRFKASYTCCLGQDSGSLNLKLISKATKQTDNVSSAER